MAQPEKIFHHFSKLPVELRLTIWNLNLDRPRLVPVQLDAASPSESSSSSARSEPSRRPVSPPPPPPQCTSPAAPPANLHACRESRAEALKRYRLSFGLYRLPGKIYFNPEVDVLYFGRREGYGASEAQFRTVLSLGTAEDLARVRRLAVSEEVFGLGCKCVVADLLCLVRERIPGVEDLFFVLGDEGSGSGSGSDSGGCGGGGQGPRACDSGVEIALVDVNRGERTAVLEHQVEAAMQIISQTHPEWRPRCRVMEQRVLVKTRSP